MAAANAQVTTFYTQRRSLAENVTLSAPLPYDGTVSVAPTQFFPQVGFGAGYNVCPGCSYTYVAWGNSGQPRFPLQPTMDEYLDGESILIPPVPQVRTLRQRSLPLFPQKRFILTAITIECVSRACPNLWFFNVAAPPQLPNYSTKLRAAPSGGTGYTTTTNGTEYTPVLQPVWTIDKGCRQRGDLPKCRPGYRRATPHHGDVNHERHCGSRHVGSVQDQHKEAVQADASRYC